jgi:hypothetical protein
MRLPERRCTHANGMIYENDFCACKVCEQQWTMTSKGWKPLVDGRVYDPEFRPKKGSFRAKPKNVPARGTVRKIQRKRRR